LAEIAHHSLEDVRRISRELRPEALDDLGLRGALIALCSRVEEQSGMRIERRIDSPLPALSAEGELAVYRIAQEALTNGAKHAGATEIALTVTAQGEHLRLTVRDNGRGFDPASIRRPARGAEAGPGVGLFGMEERARLIGGTLRIASRPGGGTEVALALPLSAPLPALGGATAVGA
jgi:two-component system sensor histidine kinase UhpB